MAAAVTAALPQADTQMSLENFQFCTVLGRGHFGKVRKTKQNWLLLILEINLKFLPVHIIHLINFRNQLIYIL